MNALALDDRKDIDAEGKVTAAFGVPMGTVRFEPSPATLVGQAIVAEIEAAGHAVADSADGTQITGAILEFETHTDTTLLYWDVIGNLAISLQISAPQRAQQRVPPALEYRTRCAARTCIWPSEAIIAGAMRQCIHDLANRLRNDGRVADALRAAVPHL